ncbi:unnamed protein product [Rotaria socialis]|uniref:Chorein N-terminal domain-containing protein n=1 Tax=Rotaria socialis TaxID=392032 RepID=A0A817UED7_9BILA|nr:unnamed protein product [Rotaria socialis]CAF4529076.1 unnamed protein product [Rotaria socialis]
MASLIKSQIIKRLSKFVKNLASNQINLSTFKGEGELSSIDLDEHALEDLIELPTWLKIRKATCARVFIKIPWTNLKTAPIQIQLNNVTVEIETCEQLRDLNNSNDSSNSNDPLLGKYGFTNRVIDGISLTITNLTFAVKAQGFKASIFLPSLEIYSTTPFGKRVDTLKLTRVRNSTKDYILLFKEISWQTARIEASSNDYSMAAAAIRLITNACRIRISMKKNLQDSTMVTSRVMIHFDDLLSVFNDAQLKSALNAYKEITHLMKRALEQKKRIAGDKLTKSEQQPSTLQPKPPTTGNSDLSNSTNVFNVQQQSNDPFEHYDVIETSFHFNIKRFDIHIIADSDILSDRLAPSGALQVTLANLSIDHYPYHQHGSSKKHWIKYGEMLELNRDEWATRLKQEWSEEFNAAKNNAPTEEMSAKLERALRTNRIRLFESCTVMNIDDLVLYPVSLHSNSKKHQEQKRRRPLIISDRTQYQLPEFLGVVNIQHTEYYYPLPYAFPVPHSDLYIQIMPVVMRIDFATFSWLDAFISSLSMTIDNSGLLKTDKPSTDLEHVAIKMEAMLPRIVISSDIFSGVHELQEAKQENIPMSDILTRNEISNQEKLEVLELNISKIILTNCRMESISSRNKFEKYLALFKTTNFFQQNVWPLANDSSNASRISSLFDKHSYETYLYTNPLAKTIGKLLSEPQSANTALHSYYTMTTDSLKKAAKYDIWYLNAESIYMDFTPASPLESVRLAKQNMTDSFSISSWAVLDEKQQIESSISSPWINILSVLETSTMLKISQKQYTFIMHLVDELGLFLDVLERNKVQSRLIRQQLQQKSSPTSTLSNDIKITLCLLSPAKFTLAVIDGLEDIMINISKSAPPSSSLEAEIESIKHNISNSNFATNATISTTDNSASTAKLELSSSSSSLMNMTEDNKNSNSFLNRSLNLSGQKRNKVEENIQRGLELTSKGLRGSSQTSLVNMVDNGDEASSQQWDQLSEDLDADLDPAVLNSDYEQQQQQPPEKPARIELDDDSMNSTEKNNTDNNVIGTNALESINGTFLKLNQIKICISEDEGKLGKPLYIACNVKHLRIDEFHSLKFDSLKPKLFENESPDKCNNDSVPPIDVRIDFPKGKSNSLPIITIKIENRTFAMTNHAIDILSKNLEEIRTIEEKRLRQSQPQKTPTIDIHLDNVQFSLEIAQEYSTIEAMAEIKPPVKVTIARMHILRQKDGHIMIQTLENEGESIKAMPSKSNSDYADIEEKLREAQLTQLENERLRAELNAHKNEITVLRGERDSLMNTISKLDIELTQAEHQRMVQQQPRKK